MSEPQVPNADNFAALAAEAAEAIKRAADVADVQIALILGSGWSSGADQLGSPLARIALETLPGFSKPVVAGHGGDAIIADVGEGQRAIIYTGRTHFYEGRGADAVAHSVRTAAALGARTLIVTNGCGSLNRYWGPGTVVLLRDHINLTGATPLHGATFIDLSEAYSRRLRDIAHRVDADLPEGVYAQFHGPAYETPAEVRMAGIMGADLVGMSTTLEVVAARAAHMEVLGLSLATNLAAGVQDTPLDHAEVIAAGQAAAPRLAALLSGIVTAIVADAAELEL
ncbi:MAG: purine-nucleoside phosphorylase [Propionibacteriaceae bacterium]|jgi:purine-nucleoside phosphorylase|nr:purine-nucleoside phosphorylase [Propionibacteriaceae bacterium]